MTNELNIKQRALLDFIQYWKNKIGENFLGTDYYIVYLLNTEYEETSNLLDSLIKNKYLAVDRNGYTRYLTYTGKEYESYFSPNTPLDRDVMRENMKKLDNETALHSLQLDTDFTSPALIAKLDKLKQMLREIKECIKEK